MTRIALSLGAVLLFGFRSLPAQTLDSVRALIRVGQRDSAWSYASARARRSPEDCDANLAVAVAAMARDDFERAVPAAELCVGKEPNQSEHQLILGQAWLEKADHQGGLGALSSAKKGRAALERALALNPDNLIARVTLVAFHLKAPGLAGGSKDEARRLALELDRRDPVMGLRVRLDVARETGNAAELAFLFDRGIPLMGKTPADTGRQLTGNLYYTASSVADDRLQEQLTQRIFAARPSDPIAKYHRARLWVIQNTRLADAERLLREYLAAGDPREMVHAVPAGAHWRLGQIAEKRRDYRAALAEYREAVRLAPAFRDAKADVARMERRVGR